MMLRDDYIVLYDDVKGLADGQFVWACRDDVPLIYQLKPGVDFTEHASEAKQIRIRRYPGRGDFLTVVAPERLRVEAAPQGAIVKASEYVFCSDSPGECNHGSLCFSGTVGYARKGQLALFEGTRLGLDGFEIRRAGGDFGASAALAGKRIIGRFAGRSGGRLCVTPPIVTGPKPFDPQRAHVAVEDKAVKASVEGRAICFELTISQRDAYKEYEIRFGNDGVPTGHSAE